MANIYTTLRHVRLALMRGRGGGRLVAPHPRLALCSHPTPHPGDSLIALTSSARDRLNPDLVDARCHSEFAWIHHVAAIQTVVEPISTHLSKLMQCIGMSVIIEWLISQLNKMTHDKQKSTEVPQRWMHFQNIFTPPTGCSKTTRATRPTEDEACRQLQVFNGEA